MRTLASTLNVSGMLERLKHTIETAGIRIFARIDHAAAARPEGIVMANTFVIIYGHPKAGTPVMLAAPAAALDLPVPVLVREDPEDVVQLCCNPVAAMLAAQVRRGRLRLASYRPRPCLRRHFRHE